MAVTVKVRKNTVRIRLVVGITGASGAIYAQRLLELLKENRKIVVVPRETPLHETHLENLLMLKRLGVTIIPPMTTFYLKPASILDLVDFIIAKILDQFDIQHTLIERWKQL